VGPVNPGGVVRGPSIPVVLESTRIEDGRMIGTVRMPDGSVEEFSGPAPAGWSVQFLAGRADDAEQRFDFRDLAERARSMADDMAARPAQMRYRLFERPFEWSAEVTVYPEGEALVEALGLGSLDVGHLHDWRERCNACPVCELHDGFHDEARHRDRVTIPAACLLPSADVKRQAGRVVRTPEEIEAVRAARAAQREG